jgi:sugar phosphate isomerase/epimerase
VKSCVTISLVAEAAGGPFVFWHDLAESCRQASQLGFDGVEIFAPSSEAIRDPALKPLLRELNLKLFAVGTGAGWVKHKLSLTSPLPLERHKAMDFIRGIMLAGAEHGAATIIGSMQGRWGDTVTRAEAEELLASALRTLSADAVQAGVMLLYEPLNRCETNLFSTLAATKEFLQKHNLHDVKILADLFHMNIEEADLPAAIRACGSHIGHVHFADSNRHAPGFGHTDFAGIVAALSDIGYTGALSAEVFARPDSLTAAAKTIETYHKVCGR